VRFDQPDFRGARPGQSEHNGAGGTARTQHRHRACRGGRVAKIGEETRRETLDIGVESADGTGLENQRVDGAGHARIVVDHSGKGKGGFLMRHGDARAGKSHEGKCGDAGCEIFRRNGKRHIRARQSVLLEPIIVHPRAKRMVHRPADYCRKLPIPHDSSAPFSRKAARSAISGNPRMQKRSPDISEKSCAPRPSIL